MTPQELKNSILQLAMQGLTIYDIKTNPLKTIHFEASDNDFVFPEHWEIWRFDRLNLINAKVPQFLGKKKYYSTGSINGNSYTEEGEYSFYEMPSRAGRYGIENSILEAKMQNTVKATVVNGHLVGALFSTGFFQIGCGESYIQDYVKYYLLSPLFIEQKNALCTGTTQKAINDKSLKSILIPIPPIDEQHMIVSTIEALLPLIDRYEQAWSRLETFNKRFPGDMQKAITHAAIQGKLVVQNHSEGTGEEYYKSLLSERAKLIKEGKIKKEKPVSNITEEEIPFEIPETWKWVRLGEIIQFQGGYAYKSTSYVPSSNNQVIRLGNVKTNSLLLDAKQVFIPDNIAADTEDYQIKENDILVTMTGTRKKRDYFFTLIVSSDNLSGRKLYLNQRVGCLRPVGDICVPYLLFVLQSEIIKDLIFAKETGTANQGNIGSEDMKNCILIPLPPLAEQKRIVARLEELLPLCEKLK